MEGRNHPKLLLRRYVLPSFSLPPKVSLLLRCSFAEQKLFGFVIEHTLLVKVLPEGIYFIDVK